MMTKIKYLSTRGQESNLNFEEVLLSGLARDGGLYLPDSWPSFSNLELNKMKDLLRLIWKCNKRITVKRIQFYFS